MTIETVDRSLPVLVIVAAIGVSLVWYYLHQIYSETARIADRSRQIEAQLFNLFDLQRRAVAFFKAVDASDQTKKAVYVEAEKAAKPKKKKGEKSLLEFENDDT